MLIVRKLLSKTNHICFLFICADNKSSVSGCTRSHAMFDDRPDAADLKHIMSNLPPYNKLVFS